MGKGVLRESRYRGYVSGRIVGHGARQLLMARLDALVASWALSDSYSRQLLPFLWSILTVNSLAHPELLL